MTRSHHETLIEQPIELPSERSTGYVFAGVCALAAVVFRANEVLFWGGMTSSAAFASLATLRPSALSALNIAWFRFAELLSKIVTPVVMFVMFAAIIVPAGLIMQFWRDPLQSQSDPTRSSYWILRDPDTNSSTMRDQF